MSPETLGILFATLEQEAMNAPRPPRLIAWGGVGTPEAAAAFLATGAMGVVMESLHWQTDLVTAAPDLKSRLAKLTLEHTTLVGRSLGVALPGVRQRQFPDRAVSLRPWPTASWGRTTRTRPARFSRPRSWNWQSQPWKAP